MRRIPRPLAALAIVALISAGCSNAPAETGTRGASSTAAQNQPTATGTTTSSGASNTAATALAQTGTGSGGSNTAANREQAVKFAECMRANGVREFPDPNASGEFVYGIEKGSSLDPSTAAFKQAISACRDLEPPGALGEGKRSPKQMEEALKFAQCMRDNGVKDFPDPTDTGPLIDTTSMGKGARSIPGFQAAAQKCLKLYSGALGGR